MKKRLFLVLTVVVMMIAITACGSGPKLYAGFYSAEMPEGFVTDEWEVQFEREAADGNEEIILVEVRSGDAETAIQESLDYWGDDHQRADDITHNGITWKVETFTWNDDLPSCMLYTDTEDGNYIEITAFLMAYDNEELVAMLDTFSFEEGAYDKSYEFVMEAMESE